METKLAELRKKKKSKKGFTLVELVIVIAVLAIIAGIAIPTVTNVINNANKSADQSNAQAIEMAIKSAQSDVAVSVTDGSGKTLYDKADADKTLANLLTLYGVDSSILSSLKQGTGYHFYYDTANGKVSADNSAGSKKLLETGTKYAISSDDKLTIS